ncbi:MAG: hypothetical protein ABI083_09095, partial [Lapillicoccus sp.]
GVRDRVQHRTRDLRAELKDAAREARATAVPVGGHDTSWGRDELGSLQDLERTVNEFRNDARQAWRKRGLTPEQTREILAILSEASVRIRAVVQNR